MKLGVDNTQVKDTYDMLTEREQLTQIKTFDKTANYRGDAWQRTKNGGTRFLEFELACRILYTIDKKCKHSAKMKLHD